MARTRHTSPIWPPVAILAAALFPGTAHAQSADVEIGQIHPPAVDIGVYFTYQIGIVNRGPDTATELEFVDQLSDQLYLLDVEILASPPGATCEPQAVGTTWRVECSIPSQGIGGDHATVIDLEVNVRDYRAAEISNTVSVTAATDDPNPTNNSSTSVLSVLPPPPPYDLWCNDSVPKLFGTPGADVLIGGDGHDVINGLAGDDTIRGGRGRDDLCGAAGADTIDGEGGFDYLKGGSGSDTLRGGDSGDLIFGDGGNDAIRGMDGADELYGYDGEDVLRGGRGDDYLLGKWGQDKDILIGGPGIDLCRGDRRDVRRDCEPPKERMKTRGVD